MTQLSGYRVLLCCFYNVITCWYTTKIFCYGRIKIYTKEKYMKS